MLRLLRSIRRSLMADPSSDAAPKVRGYLLYALGEITLVVIGILIALQIGDWAERRNDEAMLVAILHDIQEDLAADVETADLLLPGGARMNALADSILAGAFDRDDYLGTGWEAHGPGPVGDDARFELFWVGMQYMDYTPTRNAYERLAGFDGVIPDGYREVLDLLSAHYVQEWESLSSRTDIFVQQIEGRHELFSHTFPWYWKLRSSEWDEEMVDWHMNSDRRRGYLRRFMADQTLRPRGDVATYRRSAIAAYLGIADALGEPIAHAAIPTDLRVFDADAIRLWTGTWSRSSVDDRAPLSLNGGVLFWAGIPLRPMDDTTFTSENFGTQRLVLTRDSVGARVVRFVRQNGSIFETWIRPDTN